jgi:hypothetical protein
VKPHSSLNEPAELPQRAAALAAPRGAAVAGVIFSILTIIGLGLVRYAIPANLATPGEWLTDARRRDAIQFALDLTPFASIAFLWFIGVLRNRLGNREDQFFATVFLASGILFVASLFGSAAITDALIGAVAAGDINGQIYYLGHHMSDALLNLFAMKMAGVFTFSTCTLGLRTGIFPRPIAYIGFASGLVLLLIIANWRWISLVFPLWILLVSAAILHAEFRSRHPRAA